ncbi:MAG: Ni,Fe-hydrogenase III large subunit, partial [Pseudomonadota bacterium]
GPIHAGIIEPGHFRFSIVGERVLRLEQRLGWKHKGIEKRFEQLPLADGYKLAGRVSGDSTVAYAWAYCLAAESLTDCTPPPRALWLRALLLERERIANHLGDLGYLGNDAALSFGLSQFLRLKEDWQRLSGELFGHRFTMDAVVPGGVARDLPTGASEKIIQQCHAIERELRILKDIYDEHAGLQDRFLTTGRLNPALASALSISGLAGRASSQAWDLRTQTPIAPYDRLDVRIVTHRNGDVAARVTVRFEEVFESLRLIRLILAQLPEEKGAEICAPLPPSPDGAFGVGWIEGWRGDVLVALQAGPAGSIRRCHCHDPSTRIWPALEHAVMGNIVPDFPLINKSFNMSYSGQDM